MDLAFVPPRLPIQAQRGIDARISLRAVSCTRSSFHIGSAPSEERLKQRYTYTTCTRALYGSDVGGERVVRGNLEEKQASSHNFFFCLFLSFKLAAAD